jgi:hypothetical protein
VFHQIRQVPIVVLPILSYLRLGDSDLGREGNLKLANAIAANRSAAYPDLINAVLYKGKVTVQIISTPLIRGETRP